MAWTFVGGYAGMLGPLLAAMLLCLDLCWRLCCYAWPMLAAMLVCLAYVGGYAGMLGPLLAAMLVCLDLCFRLWYAWDLHPCFYHSSKRYRETFIHMIWYLPIRQPQSPSSHVQVLPPRTCPFCCIPPSLHRPPTRPGESVLCRFKHDLAVLPGCRHPGHCRRRYEHSGKGRC